MKKEDLEKRISELEDEQKTKDKAPKTSDDVKAEKMMASLDKLAEPGQEFGYISKEASEAAPQYMKMHPSGKKVKDKDIPDEFNKRAESYMMALGYKAPQGREFYGHMVRMWFGQGKDGQERQSQFEDAIKKGDEVTALFLLQQAYSSSVATAKNSAAIQKVSHAPDEVKQKTYLRLADKLGMEDEDDTYKIYKIAENLPDAFNILRNKKQVLDNYKKAA